MNTPWLIQRAKFRTYGSEEKKGIDKILLFDYMGSSEFEWGALPKSLKRIRNSFDEYRYFTVVLVLNTTNKYITYFCKEEHSDAVLSLIEKLAENTIPLKAYCDLHDWMRDTPNYNPSHFWWDINNDFMFWKADTLFTEQFAELIKG